MSRFQDMVTTLLRWVLGAVFIFSGVVKCVDPVGTAIYVEKYLATYSLSELAVASEPIAIALMVVEFAVGLLLILGVCRRGVAFLSSAMLLIFTIITLLSATVLPIGECGCFGDAVKLTPWETFFKNMVLLPISIYIWHTSDRGRRFTIVDFVSVAIALVLPLSVSLYTLSTMPLVDFLPYKVGVNLRERVDNERRVIEKSTRTVLRFRDLDTGAIEEFDATATECWAKESLEFVESANIVDSTVELEYSDFVLYNSDGEDVTKEILNRDGRIALLCINDAAAIDKSAKRAIEYLYSLYPASAVYVVSATKIESGLPSAHLLVDAMTLRSIIRADVGIVVLCDGIVEYKDNI
jgi:uncharacterized membrane protein YphA (DoxX/SURF4 family)